MFTQICFRGAHRPKRLYPRDQAKATLRKKFSELADTLKMSIQIVGIPRSTRTQRVLMLLEELSLPYELTSIDVSEWKVRTRSLPEPQDGQAQS